MTLAENIVPLPVPFASDDELRDWLGMKNDPRWPDMLARMSDSDRAMFARMRAIERMKT